MDAADRRSMRLHGGTGGIRERGSSRWWRALALLVVPANCAVLVGLWLHDGGITGIHGAGDLLTSLGRITGLLGALLLLVQVLLLARLRALDRLAGYDRLTVWHRINGKLCLYLILAHVGLITVGYALNDRISVPREASVLLRQYPGIIDATIGTVLLLVVVVTSLMLVQPRLRYELWYLVHLTAYAAIVLAWFHQIPTGTEFILNPNAARYWTALYLVTLGLVLLFRLGLPIVSGFWYQLKVAEVVMEGPNTVSLRITGRHLERLRARAGQFFLWRFLTWRLGWQSHPFSLSAAPDGRSLRITVKSLGDFTSRMGEMKPGTRVLAVGPFGLFTDATRTRDRVLLIAGGVGITPIRALLEETPVDTVLIYRVVRQADILFREELDQLARDRSIAVHYITGHHADPDAGRLLSPEHLRELVPDIGQREVYVCGPPGMADAVRGSVCQAGVPSRYIHLEAFAFSSDTEGLRALTLVPFRTRLTLIGLAAAAAVALVTRLAWAAAHPFAAVATPTATSAPPPTSTTQPAVTAHTTSTPPAAAVTFSGATETTQYGPVQAAITVTGKRITAVAIATSPSDPHSQSIEAAAVPVLKSETLKAQSASINVVSGATYTSNGYIQSLQSALKKAGI